MSYGDEGAEAIGAFFIGLFFALFVVWLLGKMGGVVHDVSWTDKTCVTVTEQTSPTTTRATKYCVSGETLAKWAQEHQK